LLKPTFATLLQTQKMNKHNILYALIIATILVSCNTGNKKSDQKKGRESISFIITNLSDEEYPDNPDIGFRSSNYQNLFFTEGRVDPTSDTFKWNFTFFTKNSDSVSLSNVDISELIPTIPTNIKSQPYLSYISCINQEWNRNQIQFNQDEFSSNMPQLVRVDIARNCLNAYLWEVALYIEEDGKTLPYAHGWFDFPHELYADLFEKKNDIPYAVYKKPLENWVDPKSKKVDLAALRTVIDSTKVKFSDLSNQMYPLEGARKKKFKEIIYPNTFKTMRDLQSDSTLFATFTQPGFYNKKDPRKTQLGRLYQLKNVELNKIKTSSCNDTLYEVVLKFGHRITGEETNLVIGGLHLNDFPILSEHEANDGWKNSMGIGNHSFYEAYKAHTHSKSKNSPYYALFLDKNGRWLDSHKIGIDGPIFHFSDPQRKTLHLWLLSFERHALVGHYKLSID
jgi:hypothetical protein